ncbi:MAG: HFX_2341 family transcriptional regulator domain-containing protein [Promethearchaeota archaeon]
MCSSIIHITFNSRENHRISLPILQHNPDKLYYFTAYIKNTEQKDINMKFFRQNIKTLKKSLPTLNIIQKEIDYTNYIEIIQELSKIIKNEREINPNCKIYINIGTGSKITAIASTEASRLWNCELIYVYSNKYDPYSSGPRHKGEMIVNTPKIFPIVKPEKTFLEILKIIKNAIKIKYQNKEGPIKNKFLYKKNLLKLLINSGHLKLKSKNKNQRFNQASLYMKLNQKFLKPLNSKLNYINISKDKRNKKIYITEKGNIVLKIFKYLI